MHPTRGTRTHPKGLQSPLEVRPPHRDTRRVKAVFAGTTCSTSFLRSLLFEHWREALKRVRGIGILGSPYPRSCIASSRYPKNTGPGTLHSPVLIPLVTPMDRYTRSRMLPCRRQMYAVAIISEGRSDPVGIALALRYSVRVTVAVLARWYPKSTMADTTHDPRVDAYIESLPDWQQDICRRVRALVHAADPEVTETIKRTDR